MNKYLIINLICMMLILFGNLGISINVILMSVQIGMLVLQYKEINNGKS